MAQPPAHRRVNILLFLNEDWKDEYGGHLELWSKDLKYCDQFIRPQFNRLVVFSTTDFTWHGHQTPLNAPKNRSRRSLALYYYTIGPRPNEECFDFDCTRPKSNGVAISHMMKTACDSCLDPKCRRWE
jgi:Rps23 Pro-64 3,4-dihydroxylase Tpa1-like proline 4-hydroxylase